MASMSSTTTTTPQTSSEEATVSTVTTSPETIQSPGNDSASLNDSDRTSGIPSFPDFRSSFGPINFTFTGISSGELYIPDDNGDVGTSFMSTGNFSTTIPLAVDCSNNATFCSTTTDFTKTRIFTEDELWAENNHFAINLIPAMVFVGILMIFGIIGNLLVVYVFGFRFKSATQHFLIICLACFDLLMSGIAMPTEIADMRFHHTFTSLFACKLLRFITMFSSISSSFTLVTIAMDRHKRVTKPLTKQMTIKRARIWEVINVLGALFFSWPLLVMTGLRTSETRIPGLMGTDCSFSDDYHNTKFPLAYNAVLGIGFIILITVIGVLYFRIWKTAKGHRVYMANRSRGSISGTSLCELRTNGVAIANGSPRNAGDKRGSMMNGQTLPPSRHHIGSLPCFSNPHNGKVSGGSASPDSERNTGLSNSLDNQEEYSSSISARESAAFHSQANGMIKTKNPWCVNTINNDKADCRNVVSNNQSNGTVTRLEDSRRRAISLTHLPKLQNGLSQDTFQTHVSTIAVSNRSSPAGTPCNLTPSPILRSRSLKLHNSYCPSITSDDLRPMSSLLDSMSNFLQSTNALQTSTQVVKNSVTSTEHNVTQREDSAEGEVHVNLVPEHKTSRSACFAETCSEDNLSQIGNKIDVKGVENTAGLGTDSDNTIVEQELPDAVHETISRSQEGTKDQWPSLQYSNVNTSADTVASSAMNTTDKEQNPNDAEVSVCEENSIHSNIKEGNSPNNQRRCSSPCIPTEPEDIPVQKEVLSSTDVVNGGISISTILDSEGKDPTQMSFMEMVNASDFSHLIGERSKPMAIPNHLKLVSDDEEENLKQTRDSCEHLQANNYSVRTRKLQNKSGATILSTNNRSSLSQDFGDSMDNDLRLSAASMSPCNKRRSTVVSILEKYRIRSASAASLDNITTMSYKSASRRGGRQMDKTTIVAFAITTVFVLSFVPYLALMFVRAFVKDFDYNLSDATLCVYNIFVRFYFLNSAVNPLLYGWLNERFRHECLRLMSCCFRKKSET